MADKQQELHPGSFFGRPDVLIDTEKIDGIVYDRHDIL
jgi:hypothetical protein